MNENVILEKFSQRFTDLCKSSNTNLDDLLKYLGIKANSTLYRYMNGEMSPKISTIKYIAKYYNVNPVWLMGYDVPMEVPNIEETLNKNAGSAKVLVYGTIPAGIPVECIEDIIDTEEINKEWLKGGKQFFRFAY